MSTSTIHPAWARLSERALGGDEDAAARIWRSLDRSEQAVLSVLLTRGLVGDGDVPSLTHRDALLAKALAVRVIANRHEVYTAATVLGGRVYQLGRPSI